MVPSRTFVYISPYNLLTSWILAVTVLTGVRNQLQNLDNREILQLPWHNCEGRNSSRESLALGEGEP